MTDADEIAETMLRLRRSGWSIGDATSSGAGRGGLTGVVTGRNGENLLRAGDTQSDHPGVPDAVSDTVGACGVFTTALVVG